MDKAEVHQIIKANHNVLLRVMYDLSAIIIREIKKIKTANAHLVLKKKRNEEQKEATMKVLDALIDANNNLESNNLLAAKNVINQGTHLVKEKHKLFLLADKSQYEWKLLKNICSRS